jgi:hypothetical protein
METKSAALARMYSTTNCSVRAPVTTMSGVVGRTARRCSRAGRPQPRQRVIAQYDVGVDFLQGADELLPGIDPFQHATQAGSGKVALDALGLYRIILQVEDTQDPGTHRE